MIGARIREVRSEKGMALDELARRAHLGRSHLWRIEAGQVPSPGAETLRKIAEALDMTPGALLGEQGRQQAEKTATAEALATLPELPEPWLMLWRSLTTREERRHFLEALAVAPSVRHPRNAMNQREEAAAELVPLLA